MAAPSKSVKKCPSPEDVEDLHSRYHLSHLAIDLNKVAASAPQLFTAVIKLMLACHEVRAVFPARISKRTHDFRLSPGL